MKKIKEIIKETKFSSIMTIITFLIFIIFFIIPIKKEEINYKYIILIMGFIPFFCYLIITVLSNIFKDKKYTKLLATIITSILTFILLGYYIIVLFISLLIDIENPYKNVKYYYEYISSDYLLTIFPKKIPESAENIKLIYSPGLLQAGTITTLYYIDNNLNIQTFDKKFTKQAEWVGYKNEYIIKNGLLTTIFLETPIQRKNESDFKIYLINSNCDDSGYCNHGNFLLVAINENTKEVVYTNQQW